METLSTIDFDDIIYEDYVIAGRRLAYELKDQYVITDFQAIYFFLNLKLDSILIIIFLKYS